MSTEEIGALRGHVDAAGNLQQAATPARFAAAPGALAQAVRLAGGIQALARHLRVPKKQLTSWMEGDEKTPATVLLRALAFVRGQ